ncbi:CSMD [Mytilus coruscus]|uniref:CSMD n=1 Tax=Mytilus coruscus TaxID=42192 RepID=A0A6J8DII6_MYTCO|nr:CSMD [Mytilus coruscus]
MVAYFSLPSILLLALCMSEEAGRCLGHDCKEGQTCYFLKDGSNKCLHTECVISPPTVNHAYIIDKDIVYKLKSSIHYKCANGFKMFGNNEVVCRAGGMWSKINFECLDCGPPPLLGNATVSTKTVLTTLESYVYYKCNSGYAATSSVRVKCRSNALWSNPSATCKALCSSFPTIQNAQINSTTNQRIVDTKIFYTCNIGYEPPQMWIQCLDNIISNDPLAVWSDPNENCRRDCGEAPIPEGANMTVYRGVHSTMSLTCSDDYIATGVVNAKCENGIWDLGSFNCWWKHCGNPPYLYGAKRTFTGTIVGHKTTHVCRNDYADVAGVGSVKSYCELGGNWSTVFINCSRKCYSPPTMLNAYYPTGTTTYEGSVVFYTCESRFTLVGESDNSTCMASGVWIGPDFECIPDCRSPHSVSNAKPAIYNSTLTPFNALYECEVDYTIIGDSYISCQANSQWTTEMFICSGCTNPPSVPNAALHIDLLQSDSMVYYDCDIGFNSIGYKYIDCIDNSWTVRRFICTPCTEPQSVQNATYKIEQISNNFEVLYQCDTGLLLIGNKFTQCQVDETWTYPTFICTDCPSAPSVANAVVNIPLIRHDEQQLTYKCKTNFYLYGPNILSCQNDTTWSSIMFSCIVCPNPSNVMGASFKYKMEQNNMIFYYECVEGLTLVGDSTLQCKSNRVWTPPMFVCTGCSYPTLLAGTSITIVRASTVNIVKYSCDGGLNLIGNSEITCQESLNWTDPLFFCTGCTNPPSVPNAALHIDLLQNDTMVYYDCDSGFNSVGYQYIDCFGNSWTVRKFICTLCTEPPSVQNATYKIEKINNEFEVFYQCDNGLILIGNEFINCQTDATWKYPTFICTDCPIAPSVPNAVVNIPLIRHDEQLLTYKCINGFHLYGPSILSCQNDTTWSSIMFACIACPSPSNVTGASFKFEMEQNDMIFFYECDVGLTLVGDGTMQCQSNAEWTPQRFICTECTHPIPLNDTSISIIQDSGTYKATYKCNGGSNLIGNGIITCQENITWTDPLFFCSECSYPPIVPHGNLHIDLIQTDQMVYYDCNEGFNFFGEKYIKCENDDTWTNPTFICTPCTEPPSVQNASYNIENINSNYEVLYECDVGLLLIGNKFIDCQSNGTWTYPTLLCTECPAAPSVLNAAVNVDLIRHDDSKLAYQCLPSFNMYGSNEINCNINSTWTPTVFACIECLNPGNVTNAVFTFVIENGHMIFFYECEDGLHLIGDNALQCQSNSEWTQQKFTCSRCADPPEIANALFKFETTLNITYLRYECEPGLNLVGNGSIKCQHDNIWSQQKFLCTSCSEPTDVMNAMYTVEKLNSSYTVVYKCDDGFNLLGNGVIECQSDRSWTDFQFICTQCTDPPEIQDASFEVVHGDNNVVYECDVGLNLIGNENIECQSDGNWTDRSFICIVCSEPADVMNAMYTVEKLDSNYTVIYKCTDDFNLFGNGVMECQSDGNWTDYNFICTQCTDLPIIQKATSRIVHDDHNVVYECDEELNLIGNENIECDPDGNWTDRSFICIECTEPPAVQNATFKVVPGENIVVYECDSELNLIGNENIECQSDGNWTYPSFICIACVEPPVVKNGTYTFETVDNNHVARYRCADGFNLIGNDVIECQLNGSWTDLNLKCTDCPDPPNIMNAALNIEDIRHDDVDLTYMCNDGYYLFGVETISCQANLSWSPPTFVCTGCSNPPNVLNATVEFLMDKNNTTFYYNCEEGSHLIGNSSIICLSSNNWTTPLFKCSACSYPPYKQNTTIEVEVVAGDPVVKYSCLSGLTQIGIEYTACENNTWTSPTFICSACPYPPYIQNTTIEVEVIAGDPVVKYSCISGLTQIGFEYTACDNNTWTLPTFICSTCTYPPYIQNTTIEVEVIAGDPVVKYSCITGLTQIGFEYTACDNNTWALPTFVCSECGLPPSRPNATILVEKDQNDIIVNYTCHNGYNITGLPTLQCEMGTWVVGNFTCVSV